jgi:uncharacterized protein with gpF-like domain
LASDDAEKSVYEAAKSALTRWLGVAKDAVLAPWKRFHGQPDPDALYSTQPIWVSEVERILHALTPALQEGWAAAHLPRSLPANNPFIQANLAMTRNLLVGIPDETHAKVVAAILDGVDRGEDNDRIAQRVDDVLSFTGSENWDGRARNIAVTETTRHYNSSLLAHALLVQAQDGAEMMKSWETQTDGREREAHLLADHQRVALNVPYVVDGEPMMFPGDPDGSPHNVCGCRCTQLIHAPSEVTT